jgi:flagellar basal-body rod modification protein FlgD
MSISPTNPASTPIGGSTSGPGSTAAQPGGTLTESNFLQLMMAQLQNQDPLNPSSSDPTQYMTELAQLTSVEQQTNTAQSTAQLTSEQNAASALALLGHTVTYTDPTSGASLSGTVQKVSFSSAGPMLTVNGTAGVDPGTVSDVS